MSGATRLLPADDRIEDALLDRPITSLTDIAWTYGRLDQLYANHRYREWVKNNNGPRGFDALPFVRVPPQSEHFDPMTPDAKRQLFDVEDALISTNIVLDRETMAARLVAEDDSDERGRPIPLVSTERLTWERMIDIGYLVRPDKRGNVRDHSLPTYVNGKNAEKTASYARERLDRWTDEIALDIAEEHADGWIVHALNELGQDEDATETAEATVESTVEALDSITTNYTGIVSLRFWAAQTVEEDDGDGTGRLLGPIYPGMLPVLNDIAAAKYDEQMRGFSAADDSTGIAADYVSGTVGEVLGTSPGRPADYFKAKQEGVFANFDADRSWQNYPLDKETATTVARGSRIIDQCRSRLGPDTFARYLPYIGVRSRDDGTPRERPMNAIDARVIYAILDRVFRGRRVEDEWKTESITSVLADNIEGRAVPDGLQYYLMIVNGAGNKDKVLDERPACSVLPLRRLANAHSSVVAGSWVIDRDDDRSGPINVRHHLTSSTDDDNDDGGDRFFDREHDQVRAILSGWYLRQTMDEPERHRDTYLDPTDARIMALTAILTGDLVQPGQLTDSYVARVRRDQLAMFEDSAIRATIPHKTIAKQLIQYNALARAGLLDNSAPQRGLPITTEHQWSDSMTNDTTTNEASSTDDENYANRDERLDAYIADHYILRESPEHRASFLLGAFAARVAATQMREGVAGTITRRYSVDRIRRRELLRAYGEITETNDQYARKKGHVGMNRRYQRGIGDIISDHPPSDWSIRDTEIRAYYAAGLAYGWDDRSIDNDADDEESETDAPENLMEAGQ